MAVVCGVVISVNPQNGVARNIKRVKQVLDLKMFIGQDKSNNKEVVPN